MGKQNLILVFQNECKTFETLSTAYYLLFAISTSLEHFCEVTFELCLNCKSFHTEGCHFAIRLLNIIGSNNVTKKQA